MLSNTLSVEEYKKIYDDNNYKGDNYEVALFINFLMKKSKLIREMEELELTGLKKSQIHSYKNIIKAGRVEELKNNTFKKVLKNCTKLKPKVEENLVNEIEKLSINEERCPYEEAHFFNEMEFSPGKSTYRRNDFCPCEMEIEPCERGERQVHIPYLNFSTTTYLSLVEITEHATQVNNLEKRVRELEAENNDLKAQNKFLSEALKMSG